MSADRPAHPDDAAQVRHLRQTMDAVAARSAPSADWDALHARLQVGEGGTAAVPGRRRFGWLAVAAVIIVVSAIGAALVIARPGGEEDRVQTTQIPEGSPGGWYIPEGLPAGWKPFRVTANVEIQACLCRSAVWREVGGDGWVEFRTRAFEAGSEVEQPDPEDLTVDVGGGFRAGLLERTGKDAEQYGDWELAWSDQHHYGGVTGSGLSVDQGTAIARALVADPVRRDIPLDGYRLASDAVSPADRVAASIYVEMRRPDGGTAIYALEPPAAYVDESPNAEWNPVDLPGQDLPVETWVERSYTGPSHGYRPWTNYRGLWPGADVHAPTSANVKDGEFSPNAQQVATLMASLRPATVAEWRAFVRRAPEHSDRVLEIESVSDLVPDQATATTATSTPRETTTTVVSAAPTTSGATTANDRLDGVFPDGAPWTIERDPEHGLCAVLDDEDVGCDDVGPVVPPDADPSTVRWGITDDRWLAFGVLPEGATAVLVAPLDGSPLLREPIVDRSTGLWGVGGDNPDPVFAISERFRVRYRLADGTVVDAPSVG